jgi:hypothetical protein
MEDQSRPIDIKHDEGMPIKSAPLSALEEVMNVIMGKSPLSREKISKMMGEKEAEVAELRSV